MMIGPAVSDLDHDYFANLERAYAANSDILELQPELWSWTPTRAPQRIHWLSVHAPSQGRDIAAPDEELRRFSVEETKRGMLFAADVGATVYLLHPGQIYDPANIVSRTAPPGYRYVPSYFWQQPQARVVMERPLEVSIDELFVFRQMRRFDFRFTLENLPFPNLGSTVAEIERVHLALAAHYGLGITLDISHLWLSYHALLANPHLRSLASGFSSDPLAFYDDLRGFLDKHGDQVVYYHLHGVTTNQEHLAIMDKTVYPAEELDLCRVMGIIGLQKPIITEVFNASPEGKAQSVRNLEQVAGRCSVPSPVP